MKRRKEDSNGFEEWGGYMNAKKTKLIEQFDAESAKLGLKADDLFKGIKIFVNGYTEPSADELRMLMMKHGGQYHHYLKNGDTTHIIASNLPDSKVSQVKQYKIVKPQWITDSIKAKKVLSYQNYLLITNQSTSQAPLCFTGKPSSSPSKKTVIKNTTDDGFIDEFYANSRLHHVSTMGATFKEYINKLRINKNHSFDGKRILAEKYPSSDRYSEVSSKLIMHIDMDCFFVSVGIRDKPHLKGKPVAVTHSKSGAGNHREGVNLLQEIEAYRKRLGYGPGEKAGASEKKFSTSASMAEIASCSYEARQFKIKNGMFVGQALKLCPHLQFIHYEFEAYKEVACTLYDSVAKYTLDIEAVSCDEMYVDLTSLFQETGVSPMEFATLLRGEIQEKTGCPCSVGFGNNKLIARLATKKAKPNGQYWIQEDHVHSFLNELPLSEIPGVGRSTSHKFKELGINTCGDLQLWSIQELQKEFGKKQGETLYNACRGKELKGLVFTHVRKSVSADVNYGIRLQNDTERDKFLLNLSGEVAKRLDSIQMKGRCLTLKLMVRSKDAPEESAKYMGHGLCDHITKSCSLLSPISLPEDIYREVHKIINRLNLDSKELRGIGIQLSRLEPSASTRNKLKDFIAAKAAISHDKCDVLGVETAPLRTNADSKKEIPIEKVDLKILRPVQSDHLAIAKTAKRRCSTEVDSFISPADLRVMIKKWIESEDSPKERDKRIIKGYLIQLCAAHQMDDVFVILKAFFVYVKRYKNSNCWINAYQSIAEKVQANVFSQLGGKLKLEEFSFNSSS
uniref:DNA repair protein REV1 n=1 Tax=Lygus hesperus TaxID=30085 RepID=A0A0A9X5V3_LYGHE